MYEQVKTQVRRISFDCVEMDQLVQSETVGNPSEIEIGEMDWISQLPEFIVHRILSYIMPTHGPPTQLVRMSVLSKKWFDLTASYPNLDFGIDEFSSTESFYKYVEYSTSRFCLQDVTAQKFKLAATLEEPAELDIVNRCLELVLNKGVKVLEIDITNSSSVPKYRLPNILLYVSVLESLTIRHCELPSSLMLDDIQFKSLIKLELENVPIDDEVIKHLTTSCPLLQDLRIITCHGFKRFCVYGHQQLQNLMIECDSQVERIDIKAPNLSNLTVVDTDERGPPEMNVASCKKLTTVTYFGRPLPNSNGFTDFLSNFPFIQNMSLVTEYECDNFKLSSHSLRTLVLQSDCDLEEIELSTPNLVLFIYASNPRLIWPKVLNEHWPLLRDSTHLKACMHCYPAGCIDALWFQKLRQFLYKKNGFKVLNLYIHARYTQKFTELEKLKAIELPPYELEHVELQLDTHEESSAHIAFVDAVLWCCRPRSLTLRSFFYITAFKEQCDVVKFTSMKLLEQEDQGHTKIQIVSPFSTEAQKQLRDLKLKSLSMALLPREGITVSFIKEEGTLFYQLNFLTYSLPHLLISSSRPRRSRIVWNSHWDALDLRVLWQKLV